MRVKNYRKMKLIHLVIQLETFFYFIQAFGIKLKLKSFVNIWVVEDRMQDLNSSTCGIFQLHFYENLFNLDKNSKIQNELFSLDDKENEIKMEEYADEIGVKISA